jgi:hypothetical protein
MNSQGVEAGNRETALVSCEPLEHRRCHKLAIPLAFILMLFFVADGGVAQTLHKLTAEHAARIEKQVDRRFLPTDATHLDFQRDQAMSITGVSPLAFLPVRYQAPNSGGNAPIFQCGLLLVADDGPTTFVATFGIDWTEAESCVGLSAVGAVSSTLGGQSDPDAHPGLILIYEASTGRDTFPEPILLTWDVKAARYHPDAKQSQWLGQQKDGHTVAGVRQLMRTDIRRPSS